MKLLNSFKKAHADVNAKTFCTLAIELFQYQARHCAVYSNYLSYLKVDINRITNVYEIPCLPIEFFKTQTIKTSNWFEEDVFLSSGTTGDHRSRHLIEDREFYLNNAQRIFKGTYGPLQDCIFFALLPSYQEQGNSSLVSMVDHFINRSNSGAVGGFYLNRLEELITSVSEVLSNNNSKKKIILFGVGYALLDLCKAAQDLNIRLDGLTIIETGGMKGRRKEMVKSEFYHELLNGLGEVKIHSEYGMTELLSQAYALDDARYRMPDQMRIYIRDPEDPFTYIPIGKTGGINVIDLANVHSCAFIETRDLGRISDVGKFEVLGRLDNSDIRGCNLMVI